MAIRRLTPEEMAYYEEQRARVERPAQLRRLRRERDFFGLMVALNLCGALLAWFVSDGLNWFILGPVILGFFATVHVGWHTWQIRKVQAQVEQDQEVDDATT